MVSLDEQLYKEKYLKYKKKYIQLKEYQGGDDKPRKGIFRNLNKSDRKAYIIALKTDIDDFHTKYSPPIMNITDINNFFDKKGYIIESNDDKNAKIINKDNNTYKAIHSLKKKTTNSVKDVFDYTKTKVVNTANTGLSILIGDKTLSNIITYIENNIKEIQNNVEIIKKVNILSINDNLNNILKREKENNTEIKNIYSILGDDKDKQTIKYFNESTSNKAQSLATEEKPNFDMPNIDNNLFDDEENIKKLIKPDSQPQLDYIKIEYLKKSNNNVRIIKSSVTK